jgi:hypothetical protein
MTLLNFDVWPLPLSFSMIVINKKVEFLGKIHFLHYDVTKWRHNVKLLVDLESPHQGLSYDWLYVPFKNLSFIWRRHHCRWRAFIWSTTRYSSFDFKIWPRGTPFSTLALSMKVKDNRPSKLISWVADHELLSHQVWIWSDKKYSKNKVFISITTWPNFDLDPCHLVWWLLSTQYLMILRWKTKKLEFWGKIQFLHHDVKFFWGPSNFEIEVFYCMYTCIYIIQI